MKSTAEQARQRVAAVDIGSNTVHMVIVDSDRESDLTVVERRVDLARLGADVAATGAIGAERAARVEATLRDFAARAEELGAMARLGLATEGVRAARNAAEVLARFSAAWGAPITLIDGMEEAALTFWGATGGVRDPALRLGVGDLGGGSCEFVVGTITRIASAISLPLGSGRLVEAVQPADPPTPADFAALAAAARAVVQLLPPPDAPLDELIAVGGTATALARFVGGKTLTVADLDRAQATLASAPAATLAARTGVDAERLRILTGGVVAWQAIMARVGASALRVSASGVREGAIRAWLRAPDGDWRAAARAALPPASEDAGG
jgi:exopolyphosphatase/guanosine-5'-triphosphate,3'-diphosphate pyrophosphatase